MNRLRVTLAGCALLVTFACAASDPGITTAVKSKLAADDTVKAYQIDVDTKEGVVTLNGTVTDPAAKSRAVELARGTDGVRNVVDNISVATPPTPTPDTSTNLTGDPGVTAAVKTKLLADTRVSGLAIDVDTRDGVVTLTGQLPNAAAKTAALEIARGTENVKSVVDRLTIGK
jgi:hyperosmotically inducible protein